MPKTVHKWPHIKTIADEEVPVKITFFLADGCFPSGIPSLLNMIAMAKQIKRQQRPALLQYSRLQGSRRRGAMRCTSDTFH